MEDYKNEFIIILAGYKNEMEQFINSNPGLRSRFPIQLNFPDFTLDELIRIAKLMLKKREYKLTMEAEIKLTKILRKSILLGFSNKGNARLVRNLIEKSIRRQAYRLVQNEMDFTRKNLQEIIEEDILEEEILKIGESQRHEISSKNVVWGNNL